MRTPYVILSLLAAGILALGAGMALAAPASSATPSPAPAAAPTPPAKAPAAKTEAKESPAIQKAEQAREAREEKGEHEATADQVARGVVTHVEPMAVPPTMVMKTMAGKQEMVVGVDVPATTIIREGKTAKTLQDIKAGDHVWMRWDRTENRLVADQIRILKPSAATAMKTAPVAAKSEVAKNSK
jgi:Cu/Ag efflux protein CusF